MLFAGSPASEQVLSAPPGSRAVSASVPSRSKEYGVYHVCSFSDGIFVLFQTLLEIFQHIPIQSG